MHEVETDRRKGYVDDQITTRRTSGDNVGVGTQTPMSGAQPIPKWPNGVTRTGEASAEVSGDSQGKNELVVLPLR